MSTTPTTTNDLKTLIFVYGSLKQGFPNHHHLENLTSSNDAALIGTYLTLKPYPLLCGPFGIPFLINLPGSGDRVRGELYSVSNRGLARLDELEGTGRETYERLKVTVTEENNGGGGLDAEAYFADRGYGEEMWEKGGKVGMTEYCRSDSEKLAQVIDDPMEVGLNLREYIRLFLNESDF